MVILKPILQKKKLRHREVQCSSKVTALVNGRTGIEKWHLFKRTSEDSYPSQSTREDESSLREDILWGVVIEGSLEEKIALCPSVIHVGFN